MIISEASALYLIPFGMTLGANAYELLAQTNLYLVPIIFIIIAESMSSRAQGLDEGSPASLALRNIEVRLLSVFFILWLCVMPLSSAPSYEFKKYSCAVDNSVMQGARTVEDVRPATDLTIFGNHNTSLMFGLVNNISQALNGALISQIPCSQGADLSYLSRLVDLAVPGNRTVRAQAATFHETCYVPAVKALERAQSTNSMGSVPRPDDNSLTLMAQKQYFGFNSPQMRMIYQNALQNGAVSEMYMTVPENWLGESTPGSLQSCATVAGELDDAIYLSLDESFEAGASIGNDGTGGGMGTTTVDVQRILRDFFNLYGQVTDVDVRRELTQLGYVNSLADSSLLQTDEGKLLGQQASAWTKKSVDTLTDITTAERVAGIGSAGQALKSGLLNVGGAYFAVKQSIISSGAMYLIPLGVSVIQSVILAMGALIIVLSGYKPKVVFSLALTYFTITLVPFWLNVGVYLQTILVSYGSQPDVESKYFSNEIIGYIFILGTPALWVAIMQTVGSAAAGGFASVASAANSIGENAIAGAQLGTSQVKKGFAAGEAQQRKSEKEEKMRLGRGNT
ncbi:hypothetical protein A6E01_19145 (plasmid) [Vibrio breoganii]|uniref:TraG N-terminal Proteobacteria domain-containing protein n=1 Tax=Vibrio breoganii TaxID=553239 RepID=A0AAN1CU32_9VIBR|nr:conjugal transfer protein TraG N-terminal domain-containing protein [Vibrio breoganii]ANO35331.1 hypothetical protein A6E01_19145 [Vibrio breoganii]